MKIAVNCRPTRLPVSSAYKLSSLCQWAHGRFSCWSPCGSLNVGHWKGFHQGELIKDHYIFVNCLIKNYILFQVVMTKSKTQRKTYLLVSVFPLSDLKQTFLIFILLSFIPFYFIVLWACLFCAAICSRNYSQLLLMAIMVTGDVGLFLMFTHWNIKQLLFYFVDETSNYELTRT